MAESSEIANLLTALCRSAVEQRLCSHIYVELGRLEDDRPSFACQELPDGAFIFDLASITKAMVTTPLILRRCYSLGRSVEYLRLKEIFSPYCFEGIADAQELILSGVLRHESGLPAWRNFYVKCDGEANDELITRLARPFRERFKEPKNIYSDVGFILLGILLKRQFNQTLSGQFLKYLESDLPEIARSLEVGPASLFSEAQCISTGWCAVRERTLKGEVHDENAWALGGFAGHSGLFSSGRAFGSYLRAFCQSRLGRMVVADNIRFAAQDLNSDSALGWRTARDPGSRVFGGGAGIGHMGFTGTAFWVDPHRRTYAVILTNRVVQSRTQNLKDIKTFRTKVLTLADAYLSERQLSHE